EIGGPTYERLAAKYGSLLKAARAEAERLAEREVEIAQQATLRDVEGELLGFLTDIRSAVAGQIENAVGVDAVRAALTQLFERFSLHTFARESEALTRFEEPGYWEPDLLLPGHGGLYVQ